MDYNLFYAKDRAQVFALYLIEHRTTIRKTAAHFSMSKSTVHKDLHEKLPRQNRALFLEVQKILEQNQAERHLRGGAATREKYRTRRERTSV
jgi:putative DeoR family transcriptional regulator (stage III sporulation protein D)